MRRLIAASPESAFLLRDLADVEAKQGKTDEALARYRRAIELDTSDSLSRTRIGEILDARGDLEGGMRMYQEANALEPTAELRRRITALDARLAYLRLPAEYRAIPGSSSITRADLASLIGLRLEGLLGSVAPTPVLITDVRNHWASDWIMATAQAGVIEPYENHTFQPRAVIMRSDLAQAVSRMLKIITATRPALLKEWQSRQQKMADVGVSNLHYADASLSVVAGILPLTESGAFQLSRAVSGAEAIDAITRLERLYNSYEMTVLTPANQLTLMRVLLGTGLRDPDRVRLFRMGLDRICIRGIDRSARRTHRADVPEPHQPRGLARSDGRQAVDRGHLHRLDPPGPRSREQAACLADDTDYQPGRADCLDGGGHQPCGRAT